METQSKKLSDRGQLIGFTFYYVPTSLNCSRAKEKDSNRLRAEYQQLVQEMLQQQQRRQASAAQQSSHAHCDVSESVPQSAGINGRAGHLNGRPQSVTVTPETLQVLASPLLPSEAVIEAVSMQKTSANVKHKEAHGTFEFRTIWFCVPSSPVP